VYRVECALECFGSQFNDVCGLDEELQLRVRFHQPVGGQRDRAHRDPPRQG
jgi:hypothetical protein